MCFRLVWGFSLFQVAILLTCALMPGSPFCRGQWLWKSQTCTKKRGWVPWFCREDALLHLWQVPHSVEVWGPKSQVWLYKMGTPNPPRSFFRGSNYIDFTKTGNVEQELPLQNGFLYISGFSGETGRPRFFHIIPLQNGPLYFWRFSFFQVAILLKCLLMPGSPLCRGQCFWKS